MEKTQRKLLDLHIEDPGARGDEPRRLNLTETASRSILNAGFHESLFFIVFSLLHVSRTFLELDAVQSASFVFKQPFLCVPVLALLYSCLKKIPRNRNAAALFDDEVCAVKNCQSILTNCFSYSSITQFLVEEIGC